MRKKSAYDEARDLFGRVGAGVQALGNRVGSFVQQNPTPISFVTKQLQPQVQAFQQRAIPNPQQYAQQNFPINLGQSVGRALQRVPEAPSVVGPTLRETPLFGPIQQLPGMITGGLRSYGRTFEALSTPQGRQQLVASGQRIAQNPLTMRTLQEPAFEAILNIPDFLPGGFLFAGGVEALSRQAGKELLEKESISYVERNLPKLILEYKKKFGNLVNPDLAKELLTQIGYNKKNSRVFHEASSILAKAVYKDILQTSSPSRVLLTAGGSGVGKSVATNELNKKAFTAIYDSNLSSIQSAVFKVEEALQRGIKPEIAFVYRDPIKAWEEGALKRAARGERVVPLDVHLKLHGDSLNTIKQLHKQYGDRIEIKIIDNRGSKGTQKEIPIEFLDKISYNVDDLTKRLYEDTIEAVRQGKIRKEDLPEILGETRGLLRQGASTSAPQGQINPSIPPSLQPLAQEARKYKSAEEFIKDAPRISSYDAYKTREQVLLQNQLNKYLGGVKTQKQYVSRLTDFYTQATREVKPTIFGKAPEVIRVKRRRGLMVGTDVSGIRPLDLNVPLRQFTDIPKKDIGVLTQRARSSNYATLRKEFGLPHNEALRLVVTDESIDTLRTQATGGVKPALFKGAKQLQPEVKEAVEFAKRFKTPQEFGAYFSNNPRIVDTIEKLVRERKYLNWQDFWSKATGKPLPKPELPAFDVTRGYKSQIKGFQDFYLREPTQATGGEIGKGGVGGVGRVKTEGKGALPQLAKTQEKAPVLSKPVSLLPQNVSEVQEAIPTKSSTLPPSRPPGQGSPPSVPPSSSSGKSITQVVNPDDPYFNINRLNVAPEVKQALKTAVEDAKPEVEKLVGKTLSNKEVIDQSNISSRVLHKAVDREQTKQWEAAMLNARKTLADMAQKGTLTRDELELFLTIKSQGEDIARKLQSLSIGADPQSVTGKQLILEAVSKVNKNSTELLKAAEGVDFNDPKQAVEFYRKFVQPNLEEWIDVIRYNSMLTSPNTWINNIASNYQGTGIVAPIEKTVTGVVDFLASAVSGKKREYLAGEGAEYIKGYYTAVGRATKRAWDTMTGRRFTSYPDTRDIPLATKGPAKYAESALKVGQRVLEAWDQFFSELTESGVARAQQYKEIRGVNVLRQASPTEEAAKRLFRSTLGDKSEGYVLRMIDYLPNVVLKAKTSDNPIVRWVAKLSFPFVRVPSNIIKQGVEYSPLGLTTIPGAKEKIPQISKALIGSGVAMGAGLLAASGRLSWARPSSEKQRNLFDKAGMQEYGAKIGDRWYSYTKLHPVIGFNFALAAAVKNALDNQKISDDQADTLLQGFANVYRFYAEQSYLKQVGDIIRSAEQGVSGIPKLVSNYWQQFVPYRAFLGWLARTTDPYQREVNQDQGTIEKQLQYFFMQIPGLRQQLPIKTTPSGEPIENKGRFINAVSPVRTTQENPEYRKALENQKILSKQPQAKKDAIRLFLQGSQDNKVREITREYKLRLDKKDIKEYQQNRLKEAADLFIMDKDNEAKQILRDAKVQLTDVEVKKAAKRKAIELFKLGLDDDVKKIVRRYRITLTKKDVE